MFKKYAEIAVIAAVVVWVLPMLPWIGDMVKSNYKS